MQAGQYLSEFITDFDRRMGRRLHKEDKQQINKLIKLATSHSVLFVMDRPVPERGSEEILTLFETVPLRPPYPFITLEYTIQQNVDGVDTTLPRVLLANEQEDGVDVTIIEFTPAFGLYPSAWHPPFFATRFRRTEAGDCTMQTGALMTHAYKLAKTMYERDNMSKEPFDQYCVENHFKDFTTYLEFCRLLHEREVTFTDVVPDKKTNQMRRALGKPPLFTYKTLTIGGPKKEGHGKGGGTHASPRSHMRRGHYRTLKSGKRIWINSFMVIGNGEGFVHKDYKVVGAEA